MVKKRKDCGLRALVSRSLFHPGSELVGPAELRKREHENETGGIWEEKGQGTGLSLPFFFLFPFSHPATFSRAFYFRVYPTFWGLGQATFLAASPLTSHACSHWGLFQRESVISRGVSDILPPLPSVCRHWRLLSCYTVSLVSVS